MAIINTYPLLSSLSAADRFLGWDQASGEVVNITFSTLLGGIAAASVEVTGEWTFLNGTNVGDPGLESDGVQVNGALFGAGLKINHFGGANEGDLILHRHDADANQPANMLFSKANSDDETHGNVSDNELLGQLLAAGWYTDTYNLAARIQFRVDGTPDATEMPGEIAFGVSPAGSRTPVDRLVLRADGSVEMTNYVFDATETVGASQDGYVLKYDDSDGRIKLQAAGGGGGGIILQDVYVSSNVAASGTSQIPSDGSVPQNTEGNAWSAMDLTITPTDASSDLEVEIFVAAIGVSTASFPTIACFRDSDADALCATSDTVEQPTHTGQLYMKFRVAAGSTAETTFSFRYGINTSGAMHVNRRHSGTIQLLGAATQSYAVVREISTA